MKDRCFCKTNCNYKYYGARGITVHPEWVASFKSFYDHVGPRPSKYHSIDRIDNGGNYEPGNVRWATKKEQANNRRSSVVLTFNGEALTASQWSEKTGLPKYLISCRLRSGWTIEKALTKPVRKHHHGNAHHPQNRR
jgi:hypothetical protein